MRPRQSSLPSSSAIAAYVLRGSGPNVPAFR